MDGGNLTPLKEAKAQPSPFRVVRDVLYPPYLECHGDLVSNSIMGITGILLHGL